MSAAMGTNKMTASVKSMGTRLLWKQELRREEGGPGENCVCVP